MTRPAIILSVWNDVLRLNPASIATMAEFTLSFIIFIYFLSLSGKTRGTWLMIGLVGIITIVYLIDIGVTTFKPPYYHYFRIGHILMVSVFTFFWTWCAYSYRGASILAREAIAVIFLEAVLFIWLFSYMVQLNTPPADLDPIYFVLFSFHIWPILVLVRRVGVFSNLPLISLELYQGQQENELTKTSLSLLALAFLFSVWLFFNVFSYISGSPLIYHLGQMTLLLGLLILHINYAPEKTTFQVKLISLPLATTLALLGLIPFLLFGYTPPKVIGT